ncbi:MAG: type I restriction-modification system subunit M N-terminal domain-containing protein, partial [Propionibacteriaceae bacterium]|nr:type I restriction-modification system subunit M N-terminal domain-containing protein [Propionibacteriaceae bacterium]
VGPTEAHTAKVMQQAIWTTADRYLRSIVEPEDYGDYIIPFTVLRRLECLLADTKPALLDFLASTNLSGQILDMTIQHKFSLHFYSSSPLDLTVIAKTDDKVLESLELYLDSFSESIRDIWTHFKLNERAATLANAGRLWGVIKHFAVLDMHPERLTDTSMGDIFEDVMYRAFNTKGKGAGAFYTPRDAIRLKVDVLFSSDDDGLTGSPRAQAACCWSLRVR